MDIGTLSAGDTERVLDLLNSKDPFLPFEADDGRYVMINKAAIAFVWPDDLHWMEDNYIAAPRHTGVRARDPQDKVD